MKISIITINYNNAEGVKATLDSVAAQTCYEFEHIIIDGGSTDGSVDIIKDYVRNVEGVLCNVYWVSEKDKGIYDAMNKGVSKASGDYLYFLNSGDTLFSPTILKDMVALLDGTDYIVGRVNKTINGQIVGKTDLLSEKDMSLYKMYLHGINHQSALIKKDLLMQNPYDISVKISADWKSFVQAIVIGRASTKFVDIFFANYDISGLSSDIVAIYRERANIITTIVPERIARDYIGITPYHQEVIRIEWLLRHPFFYRVYRAWTTLGRKLLKQ